MSERVREALADPEVRKRISEGTKAGMAARAERLEADLDAIWESCSRTIKDRFLDRLPKGNKG
ncbi:hypothetical protein UB31_09670 [Bradyrhizobium sp. LTSP849]|nr:hypothetical protein UB31_09670 [Bradyrhizobium sp. LTSP849]